LEVVVVVAMMLLVEVEVVDLFPEQLKYHSEPYITSLQVVVDQVLEVIQLQLEMVPIRHLVLLPQ
jgi:hypothetical protein